MAITHDNLISLGFTPQADRPNDYRYKNEIARLETATGELHIQDFKVPISQVSDLKYFLEVIDCLYPEAQVMGLPVVKEMSNG